MSVRGVSMTNREVYAHGLLNRALDPQTQPDSIREFLVAEEDLLTQLVGDGSRVVDFGCGTGRHLHGLAHRVSLGIGLDYEVSYVAEAADRGSQERVHFIVADGAAVPLLPPFDLAVCLTSTWGTMGNKFAVLAEMRRLAPTPGTRLITAYAPGSVAARTEWYARLGHRVTDVTDEHMVADGFKSEHFSEERLKDLLGDCVVHRLGEIGYLAEA
jgi:SAM-dependent methyltransferase